MSPDLFTQLPMMRRFAGLLLGSTTDGDRLVEEALRHAPASNALEGEADLRVAMLGRIIDAYAGWDRPSAAPNDGAGAADAGSTRSLTRAISDLAPADRIPLLLVGVLGVSTEDAAILLDTTERDVRRRVARARRFILLPGTGCLSSRCAQWASDVRSLTRS